MQAASLSCDVQMILLASTTFSSAGVKRSASGNGFSSRKCLPVYNQQKPRTPHMAKVGDGG